MYQKVETNSIVVFPHSDLKYMRLDLQLEIPFSFPYIKKKEGWADFLIRIDPTKNKKIYIMVPSKLDNKNYSQSVIDAISKYKINTLVLIQ